MGEMKHRGAVFAVGLGTCLVPVCCKGPATGTGMVLDVELAFHPFFSFLITGGRGGMGVGLVTAVGGGGGGGVAAAVFLCHSSNTCILSSCWSTKSGACQISAEFQALMKL